MKPRVGPLEPAAASPAVAESLRDLERADRDLLILRTVAHAEAIFRSFLRYSGGLLGVLELPARVRELVILRSAERLGSDYEWREHEGFARDAGVTDSEMLALRKGEVPPTLSVIELACIAATDDVVRRDFEAPSLDRARDLLGARQFTEFALVAGWWAGAVPLTAGVLGLDGSEFRRE